MFFLKHFQAHKLATEAHLITSMRITDISIALKSARSRVRLNEIQSTLLEQRYDTITIQKFRI